MKNNKLRLIVAVVVALPLLALSTSVMASYTGGTLSTGINSTVGNNVNGVVVVAPTASPVAATYNSTQSVTLTAAGSISIHYTTDGSVPTCSTGTVYSGAISVSSSEVITAISCYQNNYYSSVATFGYAIVPVSTGGNTGGSTGGNATPTTNNVWNYTNVGILDFSILMSEWGQTGSGLSADLNNDGKVDILDFSMLMANWNGQ